MTGCPSLHAAVDFGVPWAGTSVLTWRLCSELTSGWPCKRQLVVSGVHYRIDSVVAKPGMQVVRGRRSLRARFGAESRVLKNLFICRDHLFRGVSSHILASASTRVSVYRCTCSTCWWEESCDTFEVPIWSQCAKGLEADPCLLRLPNPILAK